jgi:hypothetical protein
MRRLAVLILLLIFNSVAAIACDLPAEKSKGAGVIMPSRFIYDEGWRIPDLKKAKVQGQGKTSFGGTFVSYRIDPPMTLALQGFQLTKESLKFLPGTVLRVDSIAELKTGERIYGYYITAASSRSAKPPMWLEDVPVPVRTRKKEVEAVLGCGYTFVKILDWDGDGVFESLEYSNGPIPSVDSDIPEWAQLLLPDQDALKKYKQQLEADRAAPSKPKMPPVDLMLPTQLPQPPSPKK